MAQTSDTIRRIVVAATAVVAVAGAFIGSGAAGGTPVQEAGGGAFDADGTALAPGGPAFSIWSVIYLGLVAYAVWQLLPKQAESERHRKLGYPVAWSLALNAAWLFALQLDLVWLTVPIILALLAVLIYAFAVCLDLRPRGRIDAIVTDGTIGLYLGWVCVATAANIAAALVAYGFDGFGLAEEGWAIPVLMVAGGAGIALALRGRGRIAPALSLSWGLAWIAIARLSGDPVSVPTGITAIGVVVIVLAVTVWVRLASERATVD
jgi:hypothetical protein